MKKLQIIILILVIISFGALFVYFEPSETKLQKVVIMMPFISQPQWIPYYTAIDKGYYKDEGLGVEIQYSTQGDSGAVEQQLIGGSVSFIHTSEESILMANSRGMNIVSVYKIEPKSVFYIVSEKSKNISKPEDLIGKSIGVIGPASDTYTNLLIVLNLSKISMNSVSVINAGTALVPSFLERKFDAVSIHLSQKLLIENQKFDLNVIKASDYSNASSGHIAVSRSLIESKPELIRKFLNATIRGLEYAVNNPEEAVDIYIKFNPDAASKKDVSQKLWNTIITEHGYKEGIPEAQSSQEWQTAQNALYDFGIVNEKVDVSKVYTNYFIS